MYELIHPEIQAGVRVEYRMMMLGTLAGEMLGRSSTHVARCGTVVKRKKNILVVESGGERRKVRVENIKGYWPPGVKANWGNLVRVDTGGK